MPGTRSCARRSAMRISDLVMAGASLFGGLWVTFRIRSIDPWTRALGALVGAAVVAVAVYQGLHGRPIANGKPIAPPPDPAALSSSSNILAHTLPLFLIVIVAMIGVVVFYAVLFVLQERNLGVLRIRIPPILRLVIYVGAYMCAAIVPMSLVKHHVLHFSDRAVHGITAAYVTSIAALMIAATVLVIDKQVRSRKAVVIALYCGLVLVAGSSPFVWATLANASEAARPLGTLSAIALLAPGPAYYLLRYQLEWM